MSEVQEQPEGWKAWVGEDEDLSWFDAHAPVYGGRQELDPAQLDAARRFVGQWLNSDSHGFRIPGTPWGRTLLHYLNTLMAHTGEYNVHQPEADTPTP